MKSVLSMALFALCSITLANQPPPPPPNPAPSVRVGQHQTQAQRQAQKQAQQQQANAASTATSASNAAATGTASANNSGVSQSVVTERSAPSLGQGSFAIQGCGVAGNAGASQPGGAAFLGFGFTPEQCYDFQLAQAYASLGAYKSACEVLNASRAGQRAKKRGVALPECSPPAPPVVAPAAPPVVVNVTPAAGGAAQADAPACAEATSRAFRKCVSK